MYKVAPIPLNDSDVRHLVDVCVGKSSMRRKYEQVIREMVRSSAFYLNQYTAGCTIGEMRRERKRWRRELKSNLYAYFPWFLVWWLAEVIVKVIIEWWIDRQVELSLQGTKDAPS